MQNDGIKFLQQELETGNGKRICVTKDAEILPLNKNQIEQYASGAGFTKIDFFGGFDRSEFTAKSDELVLVIS